MFPRDADHLLVAGRYVELMRVKFADRREAYRWSRARAHLEGKDDELVQVRPMRDRVSNWGAASQLGSVIV